MVREGLPFVIVPAVIAFAMAALQLWIPTGVFILISIFMAYFFRDPHRITPTEPGVIVSAADGRVTRIDINESETLVSVFLSPLDVHINRSPISGRLANLEYVRGKKMPATRNSASYENERNSLTIENDDIEIVCTQIAGILARRIVCWNRVGDELKRGQRFGLIKFGSRTDLRFPREVVLAVKIGDRVKGGETVIGRYRSPKGDEWS